MDDAKKHLRELKLKNKQLEADINCMCLRALISSSLMKMFSSSTLGSTYGKTRREIVQEQRNHRETPSRQDTFVE